MRPVSRDAIAAAARAIRILTVDAVRQAGIGHVGLPLGCAELATVLWSEFLKHDPTHPAWEDRDRFVLSGGHGSMLLYGLLHLSGYDLPIEEIRRFRQLGSRTPGHPEYGDTPGVETTTGPLGQGFGNAVGMALAERHLDARLGNGLFDHRTWVIASDGDLMEGAASEAASLAGHLGLGRLIVFWDDNRITIDGPTSLTFSENVPLRFEAYGWEVQQVDGHDPDAVRAAINRALESEDRPHLIACRTHIGFGSPAVDSEAAHGAIGDEATEQTREHLGWTLPPFEIPDEAREVFRANAERGAKLRRDWEERRDRVLAEPELARRWDAMLARKLPDDLDALMPRFEPGETLATRQASGRIVNALAEPVPALVGGSADLTGSNSTELKAHGAIERGKFEGRNIHYGVREHAMAAVANGMGLHGGIRPYTGTFLVFSDYARPAVRLAAMAGVRVTFVFTHDSIFVGEDGPTHQPVEHLAALRAIPNLPLWRPADARETVAAWRHALTRDDGPVAMALTRQGVPVLDVEGVEEKARHGGYVAVREAAGGPPELVIIGTGSETHLAVQAARVLAEEGRRVRAVSLPSLEVFGDQDAAYRSAVLPDAAPRLVVEAGVELGVGPMLRAGDRFLGMSRFGSSAPWKVLAEHFGFTVEAVAGIAREMLA